MTCKDCIHERACFTYSGGIARANLMGDKAETKCGLFKNKAAFIELPCKVGATLYRIDYRIKRCSLHHMYSKGNEYYCEEDYNCFLYDTPACDCGEEYYIYEIKTQNIETIVCNMKGLGNTVFLTREEAEKALTERQKKEG